MKLIVVALGGNALGNSPSDQLLKVKETAKHIVSLAESGYRVVVTHGNGPQVGMIYNAMSSSESGMPFPECGAMSQGYIGYHLQQAIENELHLRNSKKSCITLVTQVKVDADDSAFENPTKPIGQFYTEEEAKELAKANQCQYKEDAGRGYRRVIASPKPQEIVELSTIKKLLDDNNILITCGGGGIPVIQTEGGLSGVAAVIDKDLTSALLAKELNADQLVILTTVSRVKLKYNTPLEKEIDKMSISEAKQYILDKEFAPGSMLPKVEACMYFVENTNEKKAIITSLDKVIDALEGIIGTTIYKEV